MKIRPVTRIDPASGAAKELGNEPLSAAGVYAAGAYADDPAEEPCLLEFPPAMVRDTWIRRLRQQLTAWLRGHRNLQGVGICIFTAAALTAFLHTLEFVIPTSADWGVYWPFNAIIVAFLLLNSRRQWPWLIAGFWLFLVRWETRLHEPATNIAVYLFSNTIEVLVTAWTLPRFRSLAEWMVEPRLFHRFTLIAVFLAPALSSLPVALYLALGHNEGFWQTLLKWGFTDALGMSLWVPMILVLFSRETYDLFRWRALPETLLLLGSLCAASWWSFNQERYPVAFLPYPLLLLVALRLGFSGAVVGANFLALISASLSLYGHGPFTYSTHGWTYDQTLILQLYSTLAMLFVLPLSVMLIERNNFEQRLQEALAEMKQLATEDKLTGLANRRRFDQALEIEWKRAARNSARMGLLMIDADCFKSYNDLYGHLAGDECLRQIAAALAAEPLRPHDLVARYGGEEFAVLLPQSSLNGVDEIAEQMRRRVAAANILHEGNPYGVVTISVGCGLLVADRRSSQNSLIAAADSALYAAKQGGRNRIHSAGLQEEPPELTAFAVRA